MMIYSLEKQLYSLQIHFYIRAIYYNIAFAEKMQVFSKAFAYC
mgnify:FL=1